MPAISAPTLANHPYSSGDELHFFHVVPNPQAKLLGGGMGLADVGEFMVAPPDPKDDRQQVCL